MFIIAMLEIWPLVTQKKPLVGVSVDPVAYNCRGRVKRVAFKKLQEGWFYTMLSGVPADFGLCQIALGHIAQLLWR